MLTFKAFKKLFVGNCILQFTPSCGFVGPKNDTRYISFYAYSSDVTTNYSGGNTTPSPIGGNNWELMGSTDYLDLATSTGHSGSKSAKFKYNPQAAMRMISGDICLNENAAAIGKGEIFSFWVKGGTKYNFELKVRVFYSSARLTPSTQQSNNTYVEGIKVQANSEWTQVKINLDASKTYYGFSITTVANWGSNGADYFYVDDISIYGSIDPWSINK